MSLSLLRSRHETVVKQLKAVNEKLTRALAKAESLNRRIRGTTSASMIKSRQRDLENTKKEIAGLTKEREELSKKLKSLDTQLRRAEEAELRNQQRLLEQELHELGTLSTFPDTSASRSYAPFTSHRPWIPSPDPWAGGGEPEIIAGDDDVDMAPAEMIDAGEQTAGAPATFPLPEADVREHVGRQVQRAVANTRQVSGAAIMATLAVAGVLPMFWSTASMPAVLAWVSGLGANAVATWLTLWSAQAAAVDPADLGARDELNDAMTQDLQARLAVNGDLAEDVRLLVAQTSALQIAYESLHERVELQNTFLLSLKDSLLQGEQRAEQRHTQLQLQLTQQFRELLHLLTERLQQMSDDHVALRQRVDALEQPPASRPTDDG